MNEKRRKAEKLILNYFRTIDKSGINEEFYREKFKRMSDNEFLIMFKSNKFPLRLHSKGFDNDITFTDIKNSLDLLNVPMYENVNLNYIFKDSEGNAVQSEKCIVGYLHIPKMRQLNIKKSNNGTDISSVNHKTGELTGPSKVVSITDREFESISIFKLHNTMKEMLTFRSDDINNFDKAYNAIINKGSVDNSDLDETYNNISRNNLYVSLMCAQLDNNLIQ